MKIKKVILIVVVIILGSIIVIKGYNMSQKITKSYEKYQKEIHFYDPENLFQDQEVIDLCLAAKSGDLAVMDNLLKQGININTKGKDDMTPFLWFIKFSHLHNTDVLKKGFKWFIKNGADPLVIYDAPLKQGYTLRAHYTVFHTVAESPDIFYLKTILESGLVKDVDIELPEDSHPTALLQAELSDQFENFKLLLDYGADMNKKIGKFKYSTLGLCSGNMSWQFAHELLEREVDFMVEMRDNKPDIIRTIEDIVFRPSVSLNYRGIDYRQKCVEFLENHEVKNIHPWMPEDEKYAKENGKYQLYINEKYKLNSETKKLDQVMNEDKWVRFEDSYKNDPGNRKKK
jgi:hypothetical protein